MSFKYEMLEGALRGGGLDNKSENLKIKGKRGWGGEGVSPGPVVERVIKRNPWMMGVFQWAPNM